MCISVSSSVGMSADIGMSSDMSADMSADISAGMGADMSADMSADIGADSSVGMGAGIGFGIGIELRAQQKETGHFGVTRDIKGRLMVCLTYTKTCTANGQQRNSKEEQRTAKTPNSKMKHRSLV